MSLESDVDRPVVHRITSRLLVSEPGGRVLLFEDSDPSAPGGPTFWITPGGALEQGESLLDAACRELAEEAGLTVTPEELQGPVAERTVVHGYSDRIVVQSETFFAVAVPGVEISTVGLAEDELLKVIDHRWWSLPELRGTDRPIWPAGLADLVAAIGAPASWPIALSAAEESTVPTNHFAR